VAYYFVPVSWSDDAEANPESVALGFPGFYPRRFVGLVIVLDVPSKLRAVSTVTAAVALLS
jgi:hypothetical protein